MSHDFLQRSDIYYTWEHIGCSILQAGGNRVVRYARPLLIVSQKLKDLLEEMKIKKLLFSRILFHDMEEEN
jgi:hypothetical protein